MTVSWSADCPLASGQSDGSDFWYIQIYGYHQDGSDAVSDSAAYVGPDSVDGQQGLVLQIAPGLSTETFTLQVKRECQSVQTVIGTFTLTLTKCDVNALSRAQSEFDTGDAFINAGNKELGEHNDELNKFVKEFLKNSVEVGIVKGGLLYLLKRFSAAVAETVELPAALVGISVTAEQLLLLRQDLNRLSDGARSDFTHAKMEVALADASLSQGLAKGCLLPGEDKLNKLLEDQRSDDDARALIDGWDNNGVRYFSPITHEWVFADLALKQAKAALAGRSATSHTRVLRAARVPGATATQVRAAIRLIGRAQRFSRSARHNLARLQKLTNTFVKRLEARPPFDS